MKKLCIILFVLLVLPLTALAESTADSPYTMFSGVNLTGELSGEAIEMTLVYQNEDGTNFAEYLVDALTVVSYERLAPTQGMDAALAAVSSLVTAQGVEPRDMSIAEDTDASARLGHTAYRLSYTIGQNADACQALDIYAEAGEWAYRFHTLTPVSSFEDAYTAHIAEWIASLRLEEITGPQPYGEQAADAYARLEMPLASDQIELTDYEQYSEIEYEQWYAYDGGNVLFSYERFLPCTNDVNEVVAATTGMYDAVSNLNAVQDAELAARLGYPAYRVEYMTGESEGAHQNVDVFVLLDDCALCFHVETGADIYSDYQQTIGSWLDTLEVVATA